MSHILGRMDYSVVDDSIRVVECLAPGVHDSSELGITTVASSAGAGEMERAGRLVKHNLIGGDERNMTFIFPKKNGNHHPK